MLRTVQPLCKGRFASKKFNQTQRIRIPADKFAKNQSTESKISETLDSIANSPAKDTLRETASVENK